MHFEFKIVQKLAGEISIFLKNQQSQSRNYFVLRRCAFYSVRKAIFARVFPLSLRSSTWPFSELIFYHALWLDERDLRWTQLP